MYLHKCLSVGILRETKRRDLVPRMAMEEEIIDTDSPNGASTCCVYVGSDDSMVSTVSLLQKKKEKQNDRGIHDLPRLAITNTF